MRPLLSIVVLLLLCLSHHGLAEQPDDASSKESKLPAWTTDFTERVKPILEESCCECHSKAGDQEAGIDFEQIENLLDIRQNFKLWQRVIRVINAGEMPPSDRQPLTDKDRQTIQQWHKRQFVPSLTTNAGAIKPRRLSVHELRTSLRALFGFELEISVFEAEQTVIEKSLVLKLLPTDPPGPSGFTNDTSTRPFTEPFWDQFSIVIEYGLEQFFSKDNEKQLSKIVGPVTTNGLDHSQASALIQYFYEQAYRRPPPASLVERSQSKVDQLEGEELMIALRREIKTVLMSPGFLFRGIIAGGKVAKALEGTQPGTRVRIDPHEIAERLSFFLWGMPPDDELRRHANAGSLLQADIYRAQMKRMLVDARGKNLADRFAVEWLTLDEISKVSNNPPVSHALRQQPIDFISYLIQEDRPLTELIDSRVTFANPHTSKYYPGDRKNLPAYRKDRGIEVEIVTNSRLKLQATPERGGLLTMPGILAMNRGPVLRGTWILERILGTHLPEPPANIGQVPPNQPGNKLSFRKRFEIHRDQPACAKCHDQIDPLGFALQRYKLDGTYLNDQSAQSLAIDTSGKLPTGENFTNFPELKRLLTTDRREQVVRNLVERMLSYALCRELQWHDQGTIEEITQLMTSPPLSDQDEVPTGTFQELIWQVINSVPFQYAANL